MIHSISFGKRFHHLQEELMTWCRHTIGPGGWDNALLEGQGPCWRITSMFGDTTFHFTDENSLNQFVDHFKEKVEFFSRRVYDGLN